jgi:ABC-type glycerol-3-phosphate transport system substrate-binding protein
MLNFDPTVFLPGAMNFWTGMGQILAVPWTENPWGVVWRKDAFAAAGLAAPSAAWTFDDFRSACAALQTLAGSGRVKGLRAALGPIAPQMFHGPQAFAYSGAMTWGGLWQAFVRGFGASVVVGGRFALTAPATVSALQQLVDLIQRFALPPSSIPVVPHLPASLTGEEWLAQIQSMFAMTFSPLLDGSLPAHFAWARLPRFPSMPVIPTLSSAIELRVQPFGAPPLPEAPQTIATAEFALWLNSASAAPIMASAGVPPAVRSAAIQKAFWSGPGAGAASALGDWENFRDAYDGFPVVPATDDVGDAITSVVEGNATLSAALAHAEQKMNALVLR